MKHHPKGKRGPRTRVGSGKHMKRGAKKSGRATGSRKGSRKPRISMPVVGLPKPLKGKGYHGGKKMSFKKLAKKGRTVLGTVLDSGAKNASDPDTRAAMSIAGDLISKKKDRRKDGLKRGLALAFKSL